MTASQRTVPDWLSVSRETESRLSQFLDLVEKWNPKINLVSTASLSHGWERHVLDSAQLWDLAPLHHGTWLDLGSGGGFPGIVIAILAVGHSPDLHVALVESDRRKAVFLSEAVRQLELKATVHCERVAKLPPFGAQTISARALAPLSELLPMVVSHLAEGGTALFPKGQRHTVELAECRANWAMNYEVIRSKIDPEGAVIRIRNLSHV